jgi:hypothetical protein
VLEFEDIGAGPADGIGLDGPLPAQKTKSLNRQRGTAGDFDPGLEMIIADAVFEGLDKYRFGEPSAERLVPDVQVGEGLFHGLAAIEDIAEEPPLLFVEADAFFSGRSGLCVFTWGIVRHYHFFLLLKAKFNHGFTRISTDELYLSNLSFLFLTLINTD